MSIQVDLVTTNQDGITIIHGFNVERFETFVGKILTLAETLGLNERQEKAFKDLLKQNCWEFWERPAFMEEKDYINGHGKFVG